MKRDTRGQMSARKGMGVVIVLAVTALIAAFLLPIGLNEMNADKSVQLTQNTGDTDEVNPELDATLDSTDTSGSPSNATYTLTSDGESITKTIDEGSTATFSFDRGDVDVTVNSVSSSSATSTFEYPRDFAYSGAARSLWGVLGAMIILSVLLFVLAYAMKQR